MCYIRFPLLVFVDEQKAVFFLSVSLLISLFILMRSVATFMVVEQICCVSVQGSFNLWHCICTSMTSFSFFFNFCHLWSKKSSSDSNPLFRFRTIKFVADAFFFNPFLLPIQAFLSISHIYVVRRKAFRTCHRLRCLKPCGILLQCPLPSENIQ